MTSRNLQKNDKVNIIGGVYLGEHGTVDRLAGKESVKIIILDDVTGCASSVTIRRYNAYNIKSNLTQTDDTKGSQSELHDIDNK